MSWPAYLWFFLFSGGSGATPPAAPYRITATTGAKDSPANILGTNI